MPGGGGDCAAAAGAKPLIVRRTGTSAVRLGARALVAALGLVMLLGPLNALQGLAWCGMLASRLAEGPAPAALATTFDGRHPCGLCCAIAEARRNGDGGAVVAHLVGCVQAWLVPHPPALDLTSELPALPRPDPTEPRSDQPTIRPRLPPPRT